MIELGQRVVRKTYGKVVDIDKRRKVVTVEFENPTHPWLNTYGYYNEDELEVVGGSTEGNQELDRPDESLRADLGYRPGEDAS